LKLCKDRKLLTGIVDPGSSLEASGNAGQLFMNVDHDRDVMNKLSPFHRSIFQNVINNIVLLIIKMRDELPVYEFK